MTQTTTMTMMVDMEATVGLVATAAATVAVEEAEVTIEVVAEEVDHPTTTVEGTMEVTITLWEMTIKFGTEAKMILPSVVEDPR